MCIRRIALLRNIENVSPQDIVNYLKRAVRIYVIFSVLAIYNAATAYTNSTHLLFLLKVIDAVLYCINTGSILMFINTPTLCNLYFPLTSASTLWLFYVASIVLQIVSSKHNGAAAGVNIAISVITGLLSLLILGSTIFILLKLRTKVIVTGMENGIQPMANQEQQYGVQAQPMYAANATPYGYGQQQPQPVVGYGQKQEPQAAYPYPPPPVQAQAYPAPSAPPATGNFNKV